MGNKQGKNASADTIMYTYTDEAPMLATHAFFPVVKAFCAQVNVDVQLRDISVAGRVIANLSEYLKPEQRMDDVLTELGKLAQSGNAKIIKLPNISASIPQLKECIKELQEKGYALPDFPENPQNDEEKKVKALYSKVLGSAVNPVLREGNSDRRAAVPVKKYAQKYPHRMGKWDGSKTCVRSMKDGDFYSHERSVIATEDCEARIELVPDDGSPTEVLRAKLPIQKEDLLDSSFMDCAMLQQFYEECINEAKEKNILFSLHLKATMMKISDPIMFGHCVKVYFKDVFAKYADTFAKIGVDANNGLGDVYKKIATLPEAEKSAIEADIMATYETRGAMAMVDGGRGITNLHVPSDIIIDNSMPTAIRDGGKMWDTKDAQQDFLATIPDRGYACTFDEVVKFCQKNGAFDPTTMGGCPNVGLMAQKAEEYGSHPNTFEVNKAGTVRIVTNGSNKVLLGQKLAKGDIFRACQTKDAPIKDWVKLAVARARANDFPNNDKPCKCVFWLDSARAHDTLLMGLVQKYLQELDTKGLDIEILSPMEAMRITCQRAKDGLNTITATGNVLRDYLTDLFPILELNTSSKVLSVVPMLTGGAMYETGAGGSAPKHVQQFAKENHLRWDSLGEYLALTCVFDDLAAKNPKAKILSAALNSAVGTFLEANKNPSRKAKEIDNRGSHYWVARYWAEELAKSNDKDIKAVFSKAGTELAENEEKILKDMIDCQGVPVDMGGYYKVDREKVDKAMQPSETFNSIMERLTNC
jgi:isocitrate dehydrogenase